MGGQNLGKSLDREIIRGRLGLPLDAVCKGRRDEGRGGIVAFQHKFSTEQWRFRAKPATDSVPNRPPIPKQIGHPLEG